MEHFVNRIDDDRVGSQAPDHFKQMVFRQLVAEVIAESNSYGQPQSVRDLGSALAEAGWFARAEALLKQE